MEASVTDDDVPNRSLIGGFTFSMQTGHSTLWERFKEEPAAAAVLDIVQLPRELFPRVLHLCPD